MKLSNTFSILALSLLFAGQLLLSGCGENGNAQDFKRSDYYTRGVGEYPGNPKEDFSPNMYPDNNSYRNIAANRVAYASSIYDYNLTSQLATDGIICENQPQYLVLSSPEGELPRREREWMIDGGPFSKNMFYGDDTYLQYTLGNYSKTVDKIVLQGYLLYDEALANEGYEIVCEVKDGNGAWKEAGRLSGKNLPGKALRNKAKITDPNKQTGSVEMTVRSLDETINLSGSVMFDNIRVSFRMKGTYRWEVTELWFYNGSNMVDLKPSQFFNSAWMSQSGADEWVYVDLGSKSAFDKIKLYWINKADEGSIEVSDNAQDWKEIAKLAGGSNLVDEINLSGNKKGRYVRVSMKKSANGKPFVLSEIEIMGKGGLVATPAQMPEQNGGTINLSGGNWKLMRASQVSAKGEEISEPEFNTENWIVATVPGSVLSSYKNIGAVANPNYADYQLQASESFFNSDFWYRDEFIVPDNFKRECSFLNFDGINWKANVFLNGKYVGRIEGAFMRGKFNVGENLVSGKNVLAVQIIKNEHIGAIKEKNKQSTDFNGGILGADNPTFHATIGWDWIPTVRGRNIGIWNDVYVTTTGKVTVCDPLVESVLPLPDTTSAQLSAKVVVKNNFNENVKGVLEGRIGDIEFRKDVELSALEQKTVEFTAGEFAQLNIQNPRLWWPKGYGEPYLYNAGFKFTIDNSVSDSTDFRVGIRQMTFNEDNSILTLFVNGRRFIGRGGNWGFSEQNLNYRGREYDIAVAYHADMNFTMIRNWVGMTGDEEFYEACDKYGIMVWQDFWLANPCDGPDPYNEEMFIANAKDYVKRIRNHASIGLYCGRNEGYPTKSIDNALREIVKDEHCGIHYISSSADDVVSGHGPYRMLPAKVYFTLEAGNDKLHSERGMPNVMSYQSMLRTFSPKGLWPQDNEWGMHDYTREGAQGCTSFNEIIALGYGEPTNAKEFSEYAQWVNFDGHRSLFESRSKNRRGLLMWMSHPCWPSMVWQTYDYFFEPTAAYFAIKRASEPLHVQWNPATDSVEVVNYSAGMRDSLTVKAQVLNMDATVAWESQVKISSKEDSTEKCIKLEFPDNLSKVHFIKLALIENGKVISNNFYHRSSQENNYQDLRTLPEVKLQQQVTAGKDGNGVWHATIKLSNKTNTPALMTRVNLVGANDGLQILPVFYSDNYFALLPGEEKVLTVSWKDEDTRGNGPKFIIE